MKQKLRELKRMPFEVVKSNIELYGYKVISVFIENTSHPIDIICPKGHLYKAYYSNFMKGYRCAECFGNKRKTGMAVMNLFNYYNYLPLFPENDYKNSKQRLPYLCNKHLDKGILYVTYGNLSAGKGCKYCGLEKRQGSNHPQWKGGISSLAEFLRGNLHNWKKDSMANCNYKCVITGERFDVIHHLYPFLNIFNESFKELHLPINENINSYSRAELVMLEEKLLEIHSRHPLGVCLKKEIHDMFHKIYRSKNNTIKQFEEFKNDINNGIYNDKLRDVNVDISFLFEENKKAV